MNDDTVKISKNKCYFFLQIFVSEDPTLYRRHFTDYARILSEDGFNIRLLETSKDTSLR